MEREERHRSGSPSYSVGSDGDMSEAGDENHRDLERAALQPRSEPLLVSETVTFSFTKAQFDRLAERFISTELGEKVLFWESTSENRLRQMDATFLSKVFKRSLIGTGSFFGLFSLFSLLLFFFFIEGREGGDTCDASSPSLCPSLAYILMPLLVVVSSMFVLYSLLTTESDRQSFKGDAVYVLTSYRLMIWKLYRNSDIVRVESLFVDPLLSLEGPYLNNRSRLHISSSQASRNPTGASMDWYVSDVDLVLELYGDALEALRKPERATRLFGGGGAGDEEKKDERGNEREEEKGSSVLRPPAVSLPGRLSRTELQHYANKHMTRCHVSLDDLESGVRREMEREMEKRGGGGVLGSGDERDGEREREREAGRGDLLTWVSPLPLSAVRVPLPFLREPWTYRWLYFAFFLVCFQCLFASYFLPLLPLSLLLFLYLYSRRTHIYRLSHSVPSLAFTSKYALTVSERSTCFGFSLSPSSSLSSPSSSSSSPSFSSWVVPYFEAAPFYIKVDLTGGDSGTWGGLSSLYRFRHVPHVIEAWNSLLAVHLYNNSLYLDQ